MSQNPQTAIQASAAPPAPAPVAAVPLAPGSLPVAPLQPGQPPLALLVDYDGTISMVDVSDRVGYTLIGGRFGEADARYLADEIGSRTFFGSQVVLLPGDPTPAIDIARALPHDPGFVDFVRVAHAAGVPIEVVSDGLGFFIEPALARLGVADVPVITNRTTFDGRNASVDFPNGHPDCFVCGTCKRQRVLAHQAAGRSVVFVGDGMSDRYAAAYADLIFAKGELTTLCQSQGWAFEPWVDFAGLTAWLHQTLEGWRSGEPAMPARRSRPYICGPEIWGSGLSDPPAQRNV